MLGVKRAEKNILKPFTDVKHSFVVTIKHNESCAKQICFLGHTFTEIPCESQTLLIHIQTGVTGFTPVRISVSVSGVLSHEPGTYLRCTPLFD